MNNIELLERKNDIVYRVTGEILVPKEQIVDEPPVKLKELYYLKSFNCPYCMSRRFFDEYTKSYSIDCSDCPMALADNKCENKGSTWSIANDKWIKVMRTKAIKNELVELAELVREYNKSNGFGDYDDS